MKILVLNGPNLNLLGVREPKVYGSQTYVELEQFIGQSAKELEMEVDIYQSNHEGALIDEIHWARTNHDAIIINPAAYTHTSIAIMDALKAVALPTVEVHLSDVSQREDFRQISYIRHACVHAIMGEGFHGYQKALVWLKEHLNSSK